STSTPSAVKSRSIMARGSGPDRRLAEVCEKTPNRLPRFWAPCDSMPMGANEAGKRITAVDRRRVVFAEACEPVDKQGLDIGHKLPQLRVVSDNPRPGVERQQRFGGTGWAGIKGDDAVFRRAVKEEREADRNTERVPFRVTQAEITEH